eukprot:533817-Rhodomonas_salina.3
MGETLEAIQESGLKIGSTLKPWILHDAELLIPDIDSISGAVRSRAVEISRVGGSLGGGGPRNFLLGSLLKMLEIEGGD